LWAGPQKQGPTSKKRKERGRGLTARDKAHKRAKGSLSEEKVMAPEQKKKSGTDFPSVKSGEKANKRSRLSFKKKESSYRRA